MDSTLHARRPSDELPPGHGPLVRRDTIVIGASAGGVSALRRLLGALPATLPATVLVVLHQLDGPSELVDVLRTASALPVERVDSARPTLGGRIYVAPSDHHMVVTADRVLLAHGPHEGHSRPAINPLFRSAAATRGARVIAVQLTGMLDDGVAGLATIARCGGLVLVQDPEEAAFPAMPRNALERVPVDHVATLDGLATLLGALVYELASSAAVPEDVVLEARLVAGAPVVDGDPDLGRSLLVALQALDERVNTLERLAAASEKVRPNATSAYRERAAESRVHTERLRRFLIAMSEATAPRTGEGADAANPPPERRETGTASRLEALLEPLS